MDYMEEYGIKHIEQQKVIGQSNFVKFLHPSTRQVN